MLVILHALVEKLDHFARQLGIKIAFEILDDGIESFGVTSSHLRIRAASAAVESCADDRYAFRLSSTTFPSASLSR